MVIVLVDVVPSYGQSIVADGTVGTTVSGSAPFTITGGTQQLTTLFHSFQEFSPQTANTLFQLDNSQAAVDVVISRVTGTDISLIDGQLQLTGGNDPNLFLINPNGITFGANASLLLPGSFFASTAESVLFNDGLSFSSREPDVAPLLSVNVPVGLQFGAVANPITVAPSSLVVNLGESLGFLGGELQFIGSFLNAPEGELSLGSVAPGSQVALDLDTFGLDYTNATAFQDITLDQEAYADVSGDGGGTFQVQGRNVSLLGNAVLRASNLGPTDGGTVTVRASERLEVTGTNNADFTSAIYANVGGEGRGNQLVLEADQLFLSQSAFVTTDTFAQGASGGMTINANDVLIFGNSDLDLEQTILASGTFDVGQGGDIDITADRLFAQGNSLLAVDVWGIGSDAGNGGELRLNVGELVLRDGAQASTSTFGDGNSGDLVVMTTELVLREGSQVISSTFGGSGNSGDLVVMTIDSVDIAGFNTFSGDVFSSGLFSSAEPDSTGNAGNLSVTTPRLSVVLGGKVAVNTLGEGDGGNITIRAEEIEVADPIVDFVGAVSGLVANAVSGSTGNGGSLDIEANRLSVYNGGQITASTDGAGDAGTVTIRADEIDVSGQSGDGLFRSGIMSGSRTNADAGSVNLMGNQIMIRDGAGVSVNSLNGGAAGNLAISTERLFLTDGTLQAKVTGGSEGDLNLVATEVILLRQNSQILTSATGTATGGNITLRSPIIVGLENSDIIANAVLGSGGNIDITTQGLVGLVFREQLTPENDITASSEFGVSGTVAINNFDVEPDSGLVELPMGLVDASEQISQGCKAQGNRFFTTGRGGVAADPTDIIGRDRTWVDTRDLTPYFGNFLVPIANNPVRGEVAEAITWQTNAAGTIELVANTGNTTLSKVPYATCSGVSINNQN
ncbi:beta strand repeat-containing protein [Leptothoe spongobia]|uniref:S-layer family protein n=1 Tax=Leptothoe spongobia TAU-MAC 1115 TaxID=1967444 RepID=A0A947GIB7_9CYAN|nr:S-layer family protein [Leptothoe spongobia]MBT9315639.1 S-layer family protein [Leptothoe spongobia TAU-MAC 1115]